MCNIIQINLNRCRAAHDLLQAVAENMKADILVTSEPNKAVMRDARWFTDSENDVAIKIVNKYVKVQRTGDGPGYVWVETPNFVIYSCYFSPNKDLGEFTEALATMGRSIRGQSGRIVITGDFNAKAPEWGHERTDRRGNEVCEWLAAENLHLMNDGKIPTFVRREQESFLDLTMCTEKMLKQVKEWKVLEEPESLSDHRYVVFRIEEHRQNQESGGRKNLARKWKIEKLDKKILCEKLKEKCQGTTQKTAEELVNIVTQACDTAMPRTTVGHNKRKEVYWWSTEISEARKQCTRIRRESIRANKKRDNPQRIEEKEAEYKVAKKKLTTMIRKAKELKWKELCDDIETDIWGLGYKIVMKRLGVPQVALTPEFKKEILTELFPAHDKEAWRQSEIQEDIQPFTLAELQRAGEKIKTKKAPGPDGIPPEVVKTMIQECPEKKGGF